MLIPHVEMSESRKKELQSSLASANRIFVKYYSLVAKRSGRCGYVTVANEKINRSIYFNEIVKSHKQNPISDLNLHGVVISNEDAKLIASIKDFEFEILSSLSNLFTKLVNKHAKTIRDFAISQEDLESEALKCFLAAFCSYADSSICFSTYFSNCIIRHLNSYCFRSNPMSALGKKALRLKRQFLEAKRKSQGKSSFDEIVLDAKIDKKDLLLLKSALDCFRIERIEENNTQKSYADIQGNKSYTCAGNGPDGFVLCSNSIGPIDGVEIDKLEMTSLERAVLIGKSNSKNLSQIARETINPKTGKPFTRMAASLALKTIREKIKNNRRAA